MNAGHQVFPVPVITVEVAAKGTIRRPIILRVHPSDGYSGDPRLPDIEYNISPMGEQQDAFR